MPNPSMREIAEELGVSTATVSMAIRDSPQISEATRKRIREAALEMGYRPNPMVSTLMTQIRSRKKASQGSTLALLGPEGTKEQLKKKGGSPYPRLLYKSIVSRAEELGYQTEIFSLDEKGATLENLLRVIHYRNIRGVLLPPFSSGNEDLDFEFPRDDLAVVAIGYSQHIERVNRVAHDQFKIAYGVTHQCLERGYQRIGLQMQERFNARTGYHYTSAFLGAHFDRNRPFSTDRLYMNDQYSPEAIVEWVREQQLDCLIAQDPNLCTHLASAGIRIPEDLGLAVLSWQADHSHISGMYHDPDKLGHAAVDLLTAHLQRNECGIPAIPKTMNIAPVWRDGSTL